jgi:large subunit ribosomal protein L21
MQTAGVLNMYAVIEHGSKQYRLAEGDIIDIELTDVAAEAKTIELNKVLFAGGGAKTKIGTPYLKNAKVIASFETTAENALVRAAKLYPTHLRRRKSSRRRTGHRQKYLRVRIDKIKL